MRSIKFDSVSTSPVPRIRRSAEIQAVTVANPVPVETPAVEVAGRPAPTTVDRLRDKPLEK